MLLFCFLGILRNLLPHGIKPLFVKPVRLSLFYKVPAAPLFIRVARNQLDMVVVIRTIAHSTQIHPLTAANYGLENTVTYIAAIDFDALFDHINFEKHYTPIPKFPAVTRDFSFVCDEELEVGKIVSCINSSGGKLVENVNVFDIYRGEKLGEQKKSVSIRVTFRADHTLTVEEADKASKKVLSALEHVLGITLRA